MKIDSITSILKTLTQHSLKKEMVFLVYTYIAFFIYLPSTLLKKIPFSGSSS